LYEKRFPGMCSSDAPEERAQLELKISLMSMDAASKLWQTAKS